MSTSSKVAREIFFQPLPGPTLPLLSPSSPGCGMSKAPPQGPPGPAPGPAVSNGSNGSGGGGENGQPNVQRIEAIKQYYNQLCTNLRHIVDQLNASEVTPQRRQTLLHQQDQVQKSLQEFTEKVLKPLAAVANTQGPRPGPPGQPPHPQAALPSRVIVPPGAANAASGKMVSPPPQAPLPPPPPPLPAAPLPFQNAPPAARQTLLALQKQAQLIQQQQMIFGQKILSKNFDSSLNHAHREAMKPRYEDGMAHCESISLLAPQRMANTPAMGPAYAVRDVSGQTARQLLAKIAPRLQCTAELEEAVLRLADEFIDGLGSLASQLALSRKATKLTRRDLELAAERMHGIVVPGCHRTTVLAASVRKLAKRPAGGASSNPHQVRMAQLKKFFAQNPHLQ